MLTHLVLGISFLASPPPGVAEGFGRLVGETWTCAQSRVQPDGSWQTDEKASRWRFEYILDGYAVQDFWMPASGPAGTNLRTYDPSEGLWRMVWATQSQPRFDHFEARVVDGEIVMEGKRWARPSFGEHTAQITFHDIAEDRFDWRYEVLGPEGPNSVFRLACRR